MIFTDTTFKSEKRNNKRIYDCSDAEHFSTFPILKLLEILTIKNKPIKTVDQSYTNSLK